MKSRGLWTSIETCSIYLNYLLVNGQYPLVAPINNKVVGELELYIGFERELKVAVKFYRKCGLNRRG